MTQVFAETNPSPEDLFQKGLAAYQNKQFEEARDHFHKVLEATGRPSAPLFHDLALTYFSMDQLPRAMAYWRKALAVDPSFSLALSGRTLMETKHNMRPWEKDYFQLWARRTMERVSLYELLWFMALLIGGSGWLWIGYLADRKNAIEEDQPKPAFPMAAAVMATILVVVLGLIGIKLSMMTKIHATVVAAKTSARSLPSDDGVGLFELTGGTEVRVRRNNGDWLQVQGSDGASGWLKRDDLLVTEEGVGL